VASWILNDQRIQTPALILFTTFAISSYVIFLISAYPATTGVLVNDGFQLIELLRRRANADRWKAILGITGAECGGARPAQWKSAAVHCLTALQDGTFVEVKALRLAMYYAADTLNLQMARAVVERLDRLASELGLQAILLESAFWKAAYLGVPKEALDNLATCEAVYPKSRLDSSYVYVRAAAAVFDALGDPKAHDYAVAALALYARTLPNGRGGLYKFELSVLQSLVSRTRNAAASSIT
jgi:hypothetical protein